MQDNPQLATDPSENAQSVYKVAIYIINVRMTGCAVRVTSPVTNNLTRGGWRGI